MIEFTLAAAVVILAVALYLANKRITELTEEEIRLEHTDHAKCMALVSHYVGDRFAAQVLRAAAEDYDSGTGRVRAQRLAENTPNWLDEGRSIPSLWLHERADSLADAESDQAEYNLAGERVL